jgi:hypothetical protein
VISPVLNIYLKWMSGNPVNRTLAAKSKENLHSFTPERCGEHGQFDFPHVGCREFRWFNIDLYLVDYSWNWKSEMQRLVPTPGDPFIGT